MSGILVIAGLVFGAYLYQPMWFDDTPYHHVSSHKSLAECQTAKTAGTDDVFMKEAVCAGGELYVKDGVSKTEKSDSTDTTMKSHWSE